MTVSKGSVFGDWREDLENSRDLSAKQITYIGFLVNWFESWRLAKRLDLSRESAKRFWSEGVCCKERDEWQKDQWAEGMRWSRITSTLSRDARDSSFNMEGTL